MLVQSSWLWVNQLFLGDEDSIQEFSLILSSNFAHLLDLGAHEGDEGEVVTVNDELILDLSTESNSSVGKHWDELVLLSSQEVVNSDGRSLTSVQSLILVSASIGMNLSCFPPKKFLTVMA